MTLDELTAELTARGVKIEAVDGKLRVDAPSGALTVDLRAALGDHKAALVARFGPSVPSKPSVPSARETPPVRIPLGTLSDYLAQNGLRVVGGSPDPTGHPWRPVLYVAEVGG